MTKKKENLPAEKDINIIFITFVFVYEILISWLLIYSFISFNLFILGYLLCLLVLISVLIVKIIKKRDSRILIFLVIFTASLGVLGPLATLIIIITKNYIIKDSKSAIDNIIGILNEDYYNEAETLYNKLTFIRGSSSEYTNSEPFIDIMKYGSFYEKQQVLILAKRYFRPKYSKILFNALKNEDNNIRVEAASLMASLEKDATDKFKELQKIVVDKNNIIKIGERYLTFYNYYVETGVLVNIGYVNNFFRRIEEGLKNIIKKEINTTKYEILLGKILFKQKKYSEAIETYRKNELSSFIKDTKALSYYLESLYQQKQFVEIRVVARQALAKNNNYFSIKKLEPILKFWTE